MVYRFKPDRSIYRLANHPSPGYFAIRSAPRSPHWLPAKIERPLPIDPLTGEILDRWPPLAADIAGDEASVWRVWETGWIVTKEDYEWLTALHAIKTME